MVPTQRHKTRAATRIILAATVALLVDPVKAAQQDEIQVYDDGVNKKGEFVMELHVNGTPKGNPTPSFPGEYLTDRGIRVSDGIEINVQRGHVRHFLQGGDGRVTQGGIAGEGHELWQGLFVFEQTGGVDRGPVRAYVGIAQKLFHGLKRSIPADACER